MTGSFSGCTKQERNGWNIGNIIEITDFHVEGETKEVLARCPEVPVYTAPFEVLTQLTGYKLKPGRSNPLYRRAIRVSMGMEGERLMEDTIRGSDYTIKIPMTHCE